MEKLIQKEVLQSLTKSESKFRPNLSGVMESIDGSGVDGSLAVVDENAAQEKREDELKIKLFIFLVYL